MKITIQLDSKNGRRGFRAAAGLLLLGALAWPAWLLASQVAGLVTFAPGQQIKAADFNTNFQLVAAAVDDVDNKVNAVTTQASGLSTSINTLSSNAGNTQTQVNNLQGQVNALTSQNAQLASLNTQLNAYLATTGASLETGVTDASFGPGVGVNTGLVFPNSTALGFSPADNAIAVDSSGRIVIGGVGGSGVAVMRLTPDGASDPAFGTNGIFTIPGNAESIAVDPTGKVVVAGISFNAGKVFFTLWRVTAAGVLDPSFGNAGVVVGLAGETPGQVVIDASGKIVVAGTLANGDLGVWRFRSNGQADPTFTPNGVRDTGFALGPFAQREACALDANGNVLAVGTDPTGSFSIARVKPDGSIDATFGVNGQSIPFVVAGHTSTDATSIAIDHLGRIYVSGGTNPPLPTQQKWFVGRFDATGTLDLTFNGTGTVMDPAGAGALTFASGMVLDGLGRPVLGVLESVRGAVVRVTTSGTLDATFGAGGIFVVANAGPIVFNNPIPIALDSSGRAIIPIELQAGGALAVARVR